MNVVQAIFFAWAGFLPMFIVLWVFWCIHRTHEERIRMLYDAVAMPTPLYLAHMHAVDQVSYGRHMAALFTFRDPKKLYPKIGVVLMPSPEFGESERMN